MTQTGDVRFQSHEELIRRLEEAETWEKMRHEQVKKLIEALKLQIPRHAKSCPAMFEGGCSCGAREALVAKTTVLKDYE